MKQRLNRLYYEVKPYLPWRTRLAARRWFAVRKRRRSLHCWPILEEAARPPAGWSGWPGGKKFAFVLSHDVEGQRGVDQARAVADLELEFGFRSSFNFVPDGDYETPSPLRDYLVSRGFEVGVHDLNHDGKLYQSRESFRAKAEKINHYLKDWNAVGFRSGFMLHNYEWLHDLNVAYDASSFDTDPFEPQPDGVETIFPFWVPAPVVDEASGTRDSDVARGKRDLPTRNSNLPARRGYVELPYTLPQDSTLFLLFREKTIDVWRRKLDWIVEHGGMALINVHPDYISFGGDESGSSDYPQRLYRELLEYVSTRYAGLYWHARPREVAEFAAQWHRQRSNVSENGVSVPAVNDHSLKNLKGKRAAVVMFSGFPYDPRPRRSAEALVKAGVETDVFCLRQDENEPTRESLNGINVHRIPMKRRRGGMFSYLWQYASFILITTAMLAARSFRRRYDLVHVHNMPDILVISALIPRLLGARVVLDLHDPMPELMMTIFGFRKGSIGVRLLEWVEKGSIFMVDRVLTVNLACQKIFGARSCPLSKIEVIMNSPDEAIFGFKERAPVGGGPRDPARPFVIMCHGSIVERHGHDLAVRAVQKLRPSIPNLELRIYGHRTPFLDEVMKMAGENGLNGQVRYLGGVNLEQIVAAIDECDLGIIPNRRSIFTELNTPTRIFEYLARAVPVVAPRAHGIQDYFREDEILFFELGDADDLAARIAYAYANPGEVDRIVARGQDIYRHHQWREERSRLLQLMDGLLKPASRG